MSDATDLAGFQPWLGLLPYSEADKELFFGRDADTQNVLRLVRREVVTVLFGRSGSGKSSLLRAGVFPKLRDEQYLPVWLRLDHSGRASYGAQVRAALEAAVAAHHIEVEILHDPLADERDDFWEYLHRVVFWDAKNQPVTPVLVFDQFEEFFTLGRSRPELTAFFDELAAVAENLVPRRLRNLVNGGLAKLPTVYNERHYKLIVSLREDFVSRLDCLSKDMPSVMHNRHSLSHMNGEQALEVVMKPGGDLVEESVARKIVRFVAAANDAEAVVEDDAESIDLDHLLTEPALLSLVCSELNLQRIKEGRASITLEQVKRCSTQILEDFYERSLEGLDAADRRFIEDRLVTAAGFRTTVPVEDANRAGLDNDEIEKLVARRLLRPEDRLGRPHIELTHDVLTKVVTHSRGLRQQREELEAQRRQRTEQDAEKQRQRRQRNMMRTARLVGVLAVALAAIAIVLLVSRRRIEAAKDLANARAMALDAIGVSGQDPELALLLSLEAATATFPDTDKTAITAPTEIEAALRTAIRKSLIRQRYEGHTSKVYSVDFDNDNRRLLTSAWRDDPTARIWDVKSGKEIAILDHAALPGETATVSSARFSPDGKKIVTTTYRDDGAVFVWDASKLRTPSDTPEVVTKPLLTFYGHHRWVTCAAFSPDGKMVATGGYDNRVRVWDPESGIELCAPLGDGRIHHTQRVRSVVFNADGTRVLSTSDDGNAVLWDVAAALRAGIPADPTVLESGPSFPRPTERSLARRRTQPVRKISGDGWQRFPPAHLGRCDWCAPRRTRSHGCAHGRGVHRRGPHCHHLQQLGAAVLGARHRRRRGNRLAPPGRGFRAGAPAHRHPARPPRLDPRNRRESRFADGRHLRRRHHGAAVENSARRRNRGAHPPGHSLLGRRPASRASREWPSRTLVRLRRHDRRRHPWVRCIFRT